VDFENEVITIQQALVTSCEADGKEYQHITAPKTENGIRTIPMLSDVKTALLNQQEWMMAMGGCLKPVDGHRDFVFMNTKGNTVSKSSFNHVLSRIIQAMNKKECESAEREGRAPDLMPHISAHVLRHTFCTRFAENDPNADTLQKIMGHSDIRITYQVYNKVSNEKKKISFRNLEGKFSL